jgi:hypothetical protein
MSTKIKVTVGKVVLDGELFDTDCAKAIAERLPIETTPNEWGD